MSTAVWPPLPIDRLKQEEDATQARELEWLLDELQETLASLRAGLDECLALLAAHEPGSTLVLSSLRSESLKGYVTRVGTRIVKGDLTLRLSSLPHPRRLILSSAPDAPTLVLQQLSGVRNLVTQCLDIVDVSVWTGNAKDANFIAGQLRLLSDNIQEARQTMSGETEAQGSWWEDPVDERLFDPPLPTHLSFHLSLVDAALVLHIRTLMPSDPHAPGDASLPGLNLRDRLALALGAAKKPSHDEADDVFQYKGQEVRVREKLRVESQDPSLLSVMAKLGALEHTLEGAKIALDVVMGKED